MSHLLQMRGLKLIIPEARKKALDVASFTDAWIETISDFWNVATKESHLLQMRGLKQIVKKCNKNHELSHLLQMRGLKPKNE